MQAEDELSTYYGAMLEGRYDCVDRIVLNAYYPMGQTGGGVRTWWRALRGSDKDLSDDQLRRIAKTGGVLGIGFWDTATCGEDAKSIAKAIRYTANLIGVDHVGLGSDFDGSVKVFNFNRESKRKVSFRTRIIFKGRSLL